MDFTERSTRVYRTKQLFTKEELAAREGLCVHEEPPFCSAACPLKLDVREFVRLCAAGDLPAARAMLELITPFARVLAAGCSAPCAAACRLNEVGEGIDIAALERAAMRYGAPKSGRGMLRFRKKKRAAVLGAELFTLSAAAEVAQKSYPTEFYVPQADAADLVRACAPFLSEEDCAAEAARLKAMDLKVHYGAQITRELYESCRQSADILCLSRGAAKALDPAAEPDEVTLLCEALGALVRPAGEEDVLTALTDARRAGVSADRIAQGMDPATLRGEEGAVTSRLYTDLSGVAPSRRKTAGHALPTAEEAQSEAARCVQCSCTECLKACPYLRHYAKSPRLLTREIYNNAGIIMGDHMMNKALNSCALCGQCSVVCPNGFDMAEICRRARENMVDTGKMSLAVHEFALYDQIFSNTEALLARSQPGFDRSEWVFFPGCQAGAVAPEAVERAYSDLCGRLPGGVGIFLGCCGAVAKWSGRTELWEETRALLANELAKLGDPVVIAACPTCAGVLREAGIPKVRGLWEVLLEIGLPDTAPQEGARVTLHDACGARGDHALQQAVRKILHGLGCEVTESELSGDKTPCCGYGGLVSCANPKMAKEFAQSIAQSAQGLPVVSYCMACRDRIAREGVKSLHLLELLYGADAGSPPGLSEKRRNRLKLKERLLKEKWGEDLAKRPLGFGLTLTEEARALMEERMILDTDVIAVMQHYHDTGEAVEDLDDGLLVTRMRLGNVTFWAKFTEDAQGYTVHRVYSHRMTVETR